MRTPIRGHPLNSPERRRIESIITKARAEAGPIRFGLAWAGGQELTLTQVVNEVFHTKQESGQQEPVTEQHFPSAVDRPTASDLSAAPWS